MDTNLKPSDLLTSICFPFGASAYFNKLFRFVLYQIVLPLLFMYLDATFFIPILPLLKISHFFMSMHEWFLLQLFYINCLLNFLFLRYFLWLCKAFPIFWCASYYRSFINYGEKVEWGSRLCICRNFVEFFLLGSFVFSLLMHMQK